MLLDNVFKKSLAIAATCMMVSTVSAQEVPQILSDVDAQPAAASVVAPASSMLTAEGELSGTVLAPALSSEGEVQQVANAKVSLVSQGKVLDIVTADEAGAFSFANVQPGDYQVVGSADGLVGSQTFRVASFSKPAAATAAPTAIMLQPASAEMMYDSFSAAPVSTFMPSAGCSTCSAGGAGFGGGGARIGGRLGGRLGAGGGRLGGRLLGRPALLAGLGGLAFLGDDDASPDQ